LGWEDPVKVRLNEYVTANEVYRGGADTAKIPTAENNYQIPTNDKGVGQVDIYQHPSTELRSTGIDNLSAQRSHFYSVEGQGFGTETIKWTSVTTPNGGTQVTDFKNMPSSSSNSDVRTFTSSVDFKPGNQDNLAFNVSQNKDGSLSVR
jgi:hypothetical protein